MLTQNNVNENDAKYLTKLVMRELVVSFNKTEDEAGRLIHDSQLFRLLLQDPEGLHDSPHKWALNILANHKDIEALEEYYSQGLE